MYVLLLEVGVKQKLRAFVELPYNRTYVNLMLTQLGLDVCTQERTTLPVDLLAEYALPVGELEKVGNIGMQDVPVGVVGLGLSSLGHCMYS